MSIILINGKAYECHSFEKKDAILGESVKVIIEGSFKPGRSQDMQIVRHGKEYKGSLAVWQNYGKLATVSIFVGE